MGKQYNKEIKRRRRLSYLKRRKERDKSAEAIKKTAPKGRKASADASGATAEASPAKKAAAKKKAPAKKAPAKKAAAKKVAKADAPAAAPAAPSEEGGTGAES